MKIKKWLEPLSVYAGFLAFTLLYLTVLSAIGNAVGRMVVMLAFYLLTALFFLTARRLKLFPGGALGFKKEKLSSQAGAGLAVFAAVALVIVGLPLLFGADKTMLGAKPSGAAELAFQLVYALIFVGPVEEMVFRGYFLSRVREISGSAVWAVVLSSLLFGLWHYPNGQNAAQVVVASLIGAVYATARLKLPNCSTLSLGLAHGLHNALVVTLAFFL